MSVAIGRLDHRIGRFQAFDCADGLVVTTEIWRQGLLDRSLREKHHHFFDKWYPKDLNVQNRIIKFNQICDPFISPANIDQAAIDQWKQRLTIAPEQARPGGFFGRLKHAVLSGSQDRARSGPSATTTFGFYGRLDADTLPYTIIESLRQHSDRALVVFAGRIRKELEDEGGLPEKTMYLGELPYDDMPNLIGATSYVLAAESPMGHVLGSNKVLDAIAMGVPEPASIALWSVLGLGLLGYTWRRKRKSI